MNLIDHLHSLGLRLAYSPVEGKICVKGTSKLSREAADAACSLIRANKDEIITALKYICPFTPEDLSKYDLEYPDLVCCPRREWKFVYRRDCGNCTGHNDCRYRPDTGLPPTPATAAGP